MIQRTIFQQLYDHLQFQEITLITGSRQVGKSTLMRMLEEKLRQQGKPTLFLQLDKEEDRVFFVSQRALIDRFQQEFGKQRGYLFIDEIQMKEDAGLFIKGIYDQDLNVKFILSGSGSLELRAKIQESMAGRKRVFEVMPLTFFEFADYRFGHSNSDNLGFALMKDVNRALLLLNEYLNFGGYPRVVLSNSEEERFETINEIYRSYLEKDIHPLVQGHGPEVYSRLIRLLAAQTGQMINLSTLANETQTSLPTIRKYLWYAERTFFLKMIPPLHGNKVKEITKSPVVYFLDPGMRNLAIRMFGNVHNHRDYGFVFQNIICTTLLNVLQRHIYDLHFWRTTNKAEVDFVIERYENPLPVEVKYSAMKIPEITRSLRSFMAHYNPTDAWVINLTLSDTQKIDNTTIHFIPLFKVQPFLRSLHDEPRDLFRASEKEIPYMLLQNDGKKRICKSSLYTRSNNK
ncbi:MAG: ATP-binding protein [Bacteroidales bacterium]|nr:ATP-binding protein [Bacteroidales bacterium]